MSSEAKNSFKVLRTITKYLPRIFDQFLQNEAGKDQKPMFWRIEFKMVDSKKDGKRLKQFWTVFYQSSAKLQRDALPQCKANHNEASEHWDTSQSLIHVHLTLLSTPLHQGSSLFSPDFIRIFLNLYYNISMSLKTEVSKKMKTQADEKKGDSYEYQQSIMMEGDG